MSEEEQEAMAEYETYKKLCTLHNVLYLQGFIKDIEGINSTTIKNAIRLIDKLQEENKELKEDNSHQWEERCRLTFKLDKLQEENRSLKKELKLMRSFNINENFINKEIIRNKIKELEKENKNIIDNKTDNIKWHIINNIIFVLEELLGDKDD